MTRIETHRYICIHTRETILRTIRIHRIIINCKRVDIIIINYYYYYYYYYTLFIIIKVYNDI